MSKREQELEARRAKEATYANALFDRFENAHTLAAAQSEAIRDRPAPDALGRRFHTSLSHFLEGLVVAGDPPSVRVRPDYPLRPSSASSMELWHYADFIERLVNAGEMTQADALDALTALGPRSPMPTYLF